MLHAFILLCIVGSNCTWDTAIDRVPVPAPMAYVGGPRMSLANPFFCFKTAQEYMATELDFDRSKYSALPVCVPENKLPSNVG